MKVVRVLFVSSALLLIASSAIAQKAGVGTWDLTTISPEGEFKSTLVITISYNGSPMVITYNGQIDKDKMGGEADYGGLATGTWSATAQKQ